MSTHRALDTLKGLVRPVVAVFLGLAMGLAVTALAGENPLEVARILAKSAFGSRYDFGMTLFYATPLIFTGLSVAIAFHAGLFNIGAEGQLALAALAAAAVGVLLPGVPSPWAPLLAMLGAMLVGGFWGWIPGWLRARRGAHEVINTIMLNFVAAGIASYVTLYLLKNPDSQNPETAVMGPGYLLAHYPTLFDEAPVSAAFLCAVLTAIALAFFLWRTTWGYELRAVGQNEVAARTAGIDPARARILAMVIAGALTAGVALSEILGSAGKFKLGFSPEYGFIGIAVALLGRNRPDGVVAAGLLFGALHKGAGDLDFETRHVTRDLSMILQALVILTVSAEGLWTLSGTLGKKRNRARGGAL